MSPTTHHFGRSVLGHPLALYAYGGAAAFRPGLPLLFIAGFHGDEPEGVEVLDAFHAAHNDDLATLAQQGTPSLIVPRFNPDGLTANTRANASGVDLNRNYPTANWQPEPTQSCYPPGPWAASEPETRAMIRLLALTQPRVIVTLHAPLRLVNIDGPETMTVPLGQALADALGYPLEPSIGYPTPGSFGTYAGVERHAAVITLEMPEGPLSPDEIDRTRHGLWQLTQTVASWRPASAPTTPQTLPDGGVFTVCSTALA